MKRAAGQVHRQQVGRVEAEEPDTRITACVMNVGPHVGLVKARESWNGGNPDWPHARHRKRDQTDVRSSFKEVQLQLRRYEPAHSIGADLPVEEEELAPVLSHHGPSARLSGGPNAINRR